MIDQEKLYNIWVYLQAEPLFWLTLTIGSYIISDLIYKKSNLFPLFNPVAISVLIVSFILIIFDIKYERYFEGAKFIHFLLGPVPVVYRLGGPHGNKLTFFVFIPDDIKRLRSVTSDSCYPVPEVPVVFSLEGKHPLRAKTA